MPDLERVFDIESIKPSDNKNVLKNALLNLNGVNHVELDETQNKLIVHYTPGLINVQMMKEVIEGHGLDVK